MLFYHQKLDLFKLVFFKLGQIFVFIFGLCFIHHKYNRFFNTATSSPNLPALLKMSLNYELMLTYLRFSFLSYVIEHLKYFLYLIILPCCRPSRATIMDQASMMQKMCLLLIICVLFSVFVCVYRTLLKMR